MGYKERVVFESGITREYWRFKLLKGNRSFHKHGEALRPSIRADGIIEPITVNEKFEVIDGQGRLYAAEKEGCSVPYIMLQGLTIDDCIKVNKGRTNWKDIDYIENYAISNSEDYKILQQLINKYGRHLAFGGIPIQTIVLASNGYDMAHRDLISGKYRYKKSMEPLILKAFDRLSQLVEIIGSTKYDTRKTEFMKAFLYTWGIVPNFDEMRLISNLKKYNFNSRICPPSSSLPTCMAAIESIYNFRLKEENKISNGDVIRKRKINNWPWWGNRKGVN